jgi:CheY-like chemotaxis protein
MQLAKSDLLPQVLIIDDDPIFSAALGYALHGRMSVSTARSLEEACRQIVVNGEYQWIFVDRALPDGNAWRFVTEWKRKTPQSKFVVISGDLSAVAGEGRELLESGAEAVLAKDNQLGEKVLELLQIADEIPFEKFESSYPRKSWYIAASVRRPAKRSLAEREVTIESPLFCLQAVHPILQDLALTETKFSAAWRQFESVLLKRHLKFTAHLELYLVMECLKNLAYRYFEIPESLANDALKLITDEAFHAQRSRELLESIEKLFPFSRAKDLSVPAVQDMSVPHRHFELRRFSYCFVSETVISDGLKVNSTFITQEPIKEFFVEHLRDESVHSVYFQEAFAQVWPHLNRSEQDLVLSWLRSDLETFLRPNWKQMEDDLKLCGLKDVLQTSDYNRAIDLSSGVFSSDRAPQTFACLRDVVGESKIKKAGVFDNL